MNPAGRHRCARILLVTLALASCTTSRHIAMTRAPQPSPAVSFPARAAKVPYRDLTDAQTRRLHDAEQVLIKQCMKGRGLHYWPEPLNPIPDDKQFPYVLTDPRWADKHGYGEDIVVTRERINVVDPNQIYFQSLSAERRQYALASFNGTTTDIQVHLPRGGVIARSSGGCMAEAEQDLYGDVRNYYTTTVLYQALTTERQNDVLSDARWLTALPRWASCMRRAGYNYDGPTALRNDLTRRR